MDFFKGHAALALVKALKNMFSRYGNELSIHDFKRLMSRNEFAVITSRSIEEYVRSLDKASKRRLKRELCAWRRFTAEDLLEQVLRKNPAADEEETENFLCRELLIEAAHTQWVNAVFLVHDPSVYPVIAKRIIFLEKRIREEAGVPEPAA